MWEGTIRRVHSIAHWGDPPAARAELSDWADHDRAMAADGVSGFRRTVEALRAAAAHCWERTTDGRASAVPLAVAFGLAVVLLGLGCHGGQIIVGASTAPEARAHMLVSLALGSAIVARRPQVLGPRSALVVTVLGATSCTHVALVTTTRSSAQHVERVGLLLAGIACLVLVVLHVLRHGGPLLLVPRLTMAVGATLLTCVTLRAAVVGDHRAEAINVAISAGALGWAGLRVFDEVPRPHLEVAGASTIGDTTG